MNTSVLDWKVAFTLFTLLFYSCKSQINSPNSKIISEYKGLVGGGCDGCELMYEGMPESIDNIDTTQSWFFSNATKIVITGTLFKNDGKTPSPNVVVYFWHTNSDGLYYSKHKTSPHGDLRGWIKSDNTGRYEIYTLKPAPYPNDSLPAHIHFSIKEPNQPNEYYSEDLVFEDDILLQPYLKKYPPANRCGSGISTVKERDGLLWVEHNFILGLNIPGYK
jgi:protocatechuate 3,4-dioxygenase, beta subunit